MFKITFTFMDDKTETYEQKDTYAVSSVAYLLKPIVVGNGIVFGLAIGAHTVKYIRQEYVPDPEHKNAPRLDLPN